MTYTISENTLTVQEGKIVDFTITDTLGPARLAAGNIYWTELLYFTISGTANLDDFSTISNRGSYGTIGTKVTNLANYVDNHDGSFSIMPGPITLSFFIKAEVITEGSETFNVEIRTGSASGPIIATSQTVTIIDISTTPVATPIPALPNGQHIVLHMSYDEYYGDATPEGDISFGYYLSTTNVPIGTVIPYVIQGPGITSADINGLPLTGNFVTTVVSGHNFLTPPVFGLSLDNLAEGTETFLFSILTTPTQTSVVNIRDISLSGQNCIITSNKDRVNEGEVVDFTITTTNIPDGTYLRIGVLRGNNYSTTKAVENLRVKGDFSDLIGFYYPGYYLLAGPNFGEGLSSALITNNIGAFQLKLYEDSLTEGEEYFTLFCSRMTGYPVTVPEGVMDIFGIGPKVYINDTSTATTPAPPPPVPPAPTPAPTPAPGAPLVSFLPTGWTSIKKQDAIVDLNSVTGLYLYDVKSNSLITRLDYIDPNKGKILGTAQQDLDYISNFDPAKYNTGSSDVLSIEIDFHWGEQQLGNTWWDLENVRYFDYEQDSLQYRISNWGKLFPGSTVEVYEWISAEVLPSAYVSATLDGIPKYQDDSAYVELAYIDEVTGIIKSKYYYWVRAKSTKLSSTKTHSVLTLEGMISNPKTQGIPYAAILKDNSVALYNIGEYLSESDTALHIGYQTSLSNNIIHSEYKLVQEHNSKQLFPPRIVKKLLDSLIGADENLNSVPDYNLSGGNKIGLNIRPRQTLIVNRIAMVEKIITYINAVLVQHPVSTKIINNTQSLSDNLYAMDMLPDSSRYDAMVDTIGALTLRLNTSGDRILVKSDSNYDGYWTLYECNADNIPVLQTVQLFDVTKFWKFINWYASGFSTKTKLTYIVKTAKDIYKLTLKEGDIVKIINNGAGLFEIYSYSSATTRQLIGLENGTIELSDALWKTYGFELENFDLETFDKNVFVEFRYILTGLAEDIFIDDLVEQYNKLLFVIIYCILAEQPTIDWAFKTSFMSINHSVDGLTQPANYTKDKWEYYLDYINEIKPYRTKIREYIINYTRLEQAGVSVTDFDLPAYYDSELSVYRSPNGEYVNKDAAMISTEPRYIDWGLNHTYSVSSIELFRRGYGYIVAPDISIISTDGNGEGAKAYATLNSIDGSIAKIYVTKAGTGYTSTPLVVISGTGTSPINALTTTPVHNWAQAVAILSNNTTRKLKTTIKFDRISYTSRVIDWEPEGFAIKPSDIAGYDFYAEYLAGSLFRYNGAAYTNPLPSHSESRFNFGTYKSVDAGSIDNANDRIMAFYQPTSSMPPRILSSLVSGIEVDSSANSNDAVLDDSAIFGGLFSSSTGISTANIIISGGTFINQLYSHSPEEHIPGTMYDSLTISVISATTGTLGYKMFIDINEVVSYTNIDQGHTTTLAEPLIITDQFITVADGNTLPTPNAPGLIPGIIYISGERIEYYTKTGAILGQLTRGCGGTSVGNIYPIGTKVEDISVRQAIVEPSNIQPHIY